MYATLLIAGSYRKQTDIENSETKWEKEDYTAKDNVPSD